MKKIKILSISLSVLAMLMVSCQSKEEKAAEFIKNELSKTLYDFDSYQPIETTVKEAKMNMYNDSICRMIAEKIAGKLEEMNEYNEKAQEAKKQMEIWGERTSYPTDFSKKNYIRYKTLFIYYRTEVNLINSSCRSRANALRERFTKLDTAKIIGWEVNHKFRCKTKGGDWTICDYRYVLDKDYKYVIIKEDSNEGAKISEVLDIVAESIEEDSETEK